MAEQKEKTRAFVTSVHNKSGRCMTVPVEAGYMNDDILMLAVQRAVRIVCADQNVSGVSWVLRPDGEHYVVSILRCVDHPAAQCKMFIGVPAMAQSLRQAVDDEVAKVVREYMGDCTIDEPAAKQFADAVTDSLKKMMGVS